MRIVLVDCYDSFTWNLVDLLHQAAEGLHLDLQLEVVRHDVVTVAELLALEPRGIVLSPGPCSPAEAGICVELVRAAAGKVPIFGVCLGLQVIGAALGARIARAPRPVHGEVALVHHGGQGVLAGLPNPLQAMRYHSLVVDEATLPAGLEVTARLEDGLVMALQQAALGLQGVQFHPESVGTPDGLRIGRNVLTWFGDHRPDREAP